MTSASPVYELTVTVKDINPRIWRRIQVPGDYSLARLHAVIQRAMGWTNSHLHEFIIRGQRFGRPDWEDEPRGLIDDRDIVLEHALRSGDRFAYRYDFGDNWEHELVVDAVHPDAADQQLPICLAGERACPPEDCGGSGGYTELLEILNNPAHEQFEEKFLWRGGYVDPDAFDINAVNKALAHLRRGGRRAAAARTPARV